MVAAIGAAAAIGGAAMSSSASKSAAKKQAASADAATQTQLQMYNQTRDDLGGYRDAGTTALNQLMGGMGQNGQFMQSYSGQDIYDDPSYKFRLLQGQDSIQSGAAAQGGLLSGATQKALLNYGQDAASQEYGNAYNRFNADQTNQYNRLANLVGVGQNAAAQTGNAGLQTGQAIANNTMAGANASAAGTIASANAWAKAGQQLGTIGTAYMQDKKDRVN